MDYVRTTNENMSLHELNTKVFSSGSQPVLLTFGVKIFEKIIGAESEWSGNYWPRRNPTVGQTASQESFEAARLTQNWKLVDKNPCENSQLIDAPRLQTWRDQPHRRDFPAHFKLV